MRSSTVGGWTRIQGAKPVQIAYILVYLVMAFYVARWRSGVLPVAAALAIVLRCSPRSAAPGWFERDKAGFATPDMLFGGTGLDANVLGLITLLILPVQVLLIAFSMQGFMQEWQVEVEVPKDDPRRAETGPGGSVPAAA